MRHSALLFHQSSHMLPTPTSPNSCSYAAATPCPTNTKNPLPTGDVEGTAIVSEPDQLLNDREWIMYYSPVMTFRLQISCHAIFFLSWCLPAWWVKRLKMVKGNLEVLENVAVKKLGLSLEELLDRIIPLSGDQLTVVRIDTGQNLRIRDVKTQRFKWVHTLNGFLHIFFSVCFFVSYSTGNKSLFLCL
jgi:hypothetical protein